MKRRLNKMLILMVFFAGLVACSKADNNTSLENETAGNTDQVNEGNKDLVAAVLADASSLDPHTTSDRPATNIHVNLYETLLSLDENYKVQPGLATEWSQVDDLTWEFTLREDVKFHNGESFTAEDVKASLERILDPDIGAPRAFLFEMISEVTIVDDFNIEIKTEYPFVPLETHLTHPASSILSADLIKEDYEAIKNGESPGSVINDSAVGTGFFKFDRWDSGIEIKLTKNDDYWGDKVKVDSVTFKVIPESSTAVAELEAGHAHIIKPIEPNQVNQLSASDVSEPYIGSGLGAAYIGLNTSKEPYDDKKLRQAISMLINTEEIFTEIYETHGTKSNGPLAPEIFGHDASISPPEYNPEKAKKILNDLGYGNGFKTTIWTDNSLLRSDVAVYIQQALAEADIEADVDIMELAAILDQLGKGNHDILVFNLSNFFADPDYFLNALFHSEAGGNYTRFADETVDKLLSEGRKEKDEALREAIYHEILHILSDEVPMIVTHHPAYLLGISKSIEGFSITGGGTFNLQHIEFVD